MPDAIVALSDLHLGTAHCRDEELLAFLDRLDTRRLLLVGDIIDFASPGARWEPLHTAIIARILDHARQGMRVDVLCGNHDGVLRAFLPTTFGDIVLADQVILDLADEQVLVFHGDRVDRHCRTHPLLRRIGAGFYDGLMWTTAHLKRLHQGAGRGVRRHLLAALRSLPQARDHLSRFEAACAQAAAEAGCDSVLCGHIHVPAERSIMVNGREIRYRNTGDWVDHATGWRHRDGAWMPIGEMSSVQPSLEGVFQLDPAALAG